MSTRKRAARESDYTAPSRPERRRFLRAAGLALAASALPWNTLRVRADEAKPLPDEVIALLGKSGLVYVSPLRSDGSESTCHGEVWYGWLDGAVVLITGMDRWKSQALARGLDRARIWVGDHGPWKKMVGRSEAFRKAPSFDAKVTRSQDAELLDRLMKLYWKKYPEEFGKWEQKMRAGFASGERVLLRYVPS